MKLSKLLESILVESFKEVENKFNKEADPTLVKNYLEKFKSLRDKHILKDNDRDINSFKNKSFNDFESFIDSFNNVKTNKQIKKESIDAPKIWENDHWIAVVPLNQESSCKYGANTKWCTAGKENNKFDLYHKEYDITLIYFINKNNNDKLSIAAYHNETTEYFDKLDNPLSQAQVIHKLGISEDELTRIKKLALKKYNKEFNKNDEEIEKIVSTISEKYDDRMDQEMQLFYRFMIDTARSMAKLINPSNLGTFFNDKDSYELMKKIVQFQHNAEDIIVEIDRDIRFYPNKTLSSTKIEQELLNRNTIYKDFRRFDTTILGYDERIISYLKNCAILLYYFNQTKSIDTLDNGIKELNSSYIGKRFLQAFPHLIYDIVSN